MIAQAKNKLDCVKIISNDDNAVIDFLSDLDNRGVIKGLQSFVEEGKGLPGCLLVKSPIDNLIFVILHNSPMTANENGNRLVLYAHNSIQGLMGYFERIYDHTAKNDELIKIIQDIIVLLYKEWDRQHKSDTQIDFLG